jgi:hypothetical protein
MLSTEDRKAFHNQAERVVDGLDSDVTVVDRHDNERSVRFVLAKIDEDDIGNTTIINLKIRPRHRFVVDVIGGDYYRTTRRDNTIDFIDKTIS